MTDEHQSRPDAGDQPLGLEMPRPDEVAREADRADDEDLEAMADTFVRDVLAPGRQAGGQRAAVDGMGIEVQRQAAHRSAMLQAPIRKLAHQGDDGGPVANALVGLRGTMEELDPRRYRLNAGGLARLVGRIPGVGTPLQRYFRKFETAQQALDAIIKDLESGGEMLRRDNLTLTDDQDAMREMLTELRRQVRLGRLIDERFAAAAAKLPEDDPQRAFVEEELLFPLRQRITDLQQQLAVCQQGVLALEVVIRNNRELMRGVDRAINVTVSALNVAVTVALALANQRLVLNRVESLNATTSAMIADTAGRLRGQGVDIQARAGSAMLDMDRLEEAFGDVMGAIDELSRYRREALPRLDEQIRRLETLAGEGDSALDRLERGNRASEQQSDVTGDVPGQHRE